MSRGKGSVAMTSDNQYLYKPYTLSEIIDLWECDGYPYNRKTINNYLKMSYCECAIPFDEWYEKIKKKTYRNMKVKQILQGKLKKCDKCEKIKPYGSYDRDYCNEDGRSSTCIKCNEPEEVAGKWGSFNSDRYDFYSAKQAIKRRLIDDGYYFTEEQLLKLVDYKLMNNIKSNKDLIKGHGECVYLTKMWD